MSFVVVVVLFICGADFMRGYVHGSGVYIKVLRYSHIIRIRCGDMKMCAYDVRIYELVTNKWTWFSCLLRNACVFVCAVRCHAVWWWVSLTKPGSFISRNKNPPHTQLWFFHRFRIIYHMLCCVRSNVVHLINAYFTISWFKSIGINYMF